jgi:hypothetical protein
MFFHPEDGGNKVLENGGFLLQHYMASGFISKFVTVCACNIFCFNRYYAYYETQFYCYYWFDFCNCQQD